ncbi:kinase-like domain-containing protein [Cantharellus anzutake]|uniref:kinase-like domain-containing protein n=1 Tax=Cantharellus anzutake TaxID=1750568 RepID=UPI0019067C98|nr:kinase-like domain-containing protein [Cantharellus anzutake]KAF8332706.1 kinase-like domain-containing protein [Cantharellus anzutake]
MHLLDDLMIRSNTKNASRAPRASAAGTPAIGIGAAGIEGAMNGFSQMSISAIKSPHRVPPGMSSSGRRSRPGLNLGTIVGAGPGGGGAGIDVFTSDPSGALNFGGKAVLHSSGELGRGNYGAVKKVLHIPTNVTMAMKEIRLELDESKLNAILMELDILHRAVAPEIVEFYGAFFIESCVYYCMEYMDAGSLEQLHHGGIPELVIARITQSMVRGLKFLKDELQVMHRDVKPTNVLVNKKGEVKLCDFGVSGQLEKSLAKTNIGCQSYMAPERIHGESQNNLGTYTVASDVWSLGLSVVELAMGQYPYPPETYSNVFAQLTAIVHGDPPELPEQFSEMAQNFVSRCLMKEPTKRATYAELLEDPFLTDDRTRELDMVAWVTKAIADRDARREAARAAQNSSLPNPSAPPDPAA